MKEYSRYERQILLKEIGREGQRRLDQAVVAVIGLGNLGAVSSSLLARAGVGRMLLIDRDLERDLLGVKMRLPSSRDEAEEVPKAEAFRRRLEEINPEIELRAEVADVNALTIQRLLNGVNLIIDGTDNFETRFLINDYAQTRSTPWIYGSTTETEGMAYVNFPGISPCFRCLFGTFKERPGTQTCYRSGTMAPVAHLIASFQATEAVKVLAGREDLVERRLWKVDIWNRNFKLIDVRRLAKNPCPGCRQRDYPYLKPSLWEASVALAGRNTVRIHVSRNGPLDIERLGREIRKRNHVYSSGNFVRWRVGLLEVSVFAGGHALVYGSENTEEAMEAYRCVAGGLDFGRPV